MKWTLTEFIPECGKLIQETVARGPLDGDKFTETALKQAFAYLKDRFDAPEWNIEKLGKWEQIFEDQYAIAISVSHKNTWWAKSFKLYMDV